MKEYFTNLSKRLSFILRHKPESIGVSLDKDGWLNIDLLLTTLQRTGIRIDKKTILTIVAQSDKKRFEISEDKQQIRAVYGHSSPQADIGYAETAPPPHLYHGTAQRFLRSIKKQGLHAGVRHYVHLSENIETALNVGQRHGKAVVLKVLAAAMHENGFVFYSMNSGIWLTKSVPPAFIADLDDK